MFNWFFRLFRGATLEEKKQEVYILLRWSESEYNDCKRWNAWREANPFADVDLSGSFLMQVDLTGANLKEVDLTGAILTQAILTGADLTRADLTGADLSKADLTGAILRKTLLAGARLHNAFLAGVDLSGADVSEVDLSVVSGLEAVIGLPVKTTQANLDLILAAQKRTLERIEIVPN